MSNEEQNSNETEELNKAPEYVDNEISNENGVIISNRVFNEGKFAGLNTYIKSYGTVQAAMDDIGAEAVLDAANALVNRGLYQKARNSAPSFKDDVKTDEAPHGVKFAEWVNEQINKGTNSLVTLQEATSWQPGQRATKTLVGYQKDYFAAVKLLKEAKLLIDAEDENAPSDEEYAELLSDARLAKRLFEEEQAKQDAEMAELGL